MYRSLIKIEMLMTKRNLFALMMTVALPMAFFLLFSTVLVTGSNAEVERHVVKQIMFNMAVMSVISVGLFSCPFMILEDRANQWLKIVKRSPVGSLRYYIAKFTRVFVYYFLGVLGCFMAGALVKNVTMSPKDWLASGVIILIGSFAFLILGMAISLFNSEQSVSAVSNILYFSLAILGGLWIPVSQFPVWMQDVAKVTPTYHLANIVNKFNENGSFEIGSIGVMLVYSVVFMAIIFVIKRRQDVK